VNREERASDLGNKIGHRGCTGHDKEGDWVDGS
jgi:hypothetical protein